MSKKRIRAQFYDAGPQHNLAWWTLPATADAYEQMVEQVAKAESDYAIATCGESQNWDDGECARRILRAIGITPPKKGRT